MTPAALEMIGRWFIIFLSASGMVLWLGLAWSAFSERHHCPECGCLHSVKERKP